MKKYILSLLLFLAGCASNTGINGLVTADGVKGEYPYDTDYFVWSTVDTLSKYYSPAKTTFNLIKVNGAFGNKLQSKLQSSGYAVKIVSSKAKSLPKDGVTLAYIYDEVKDENNPTAYVHIHLSDGQHFSIARKLRIVEIPKIRPLKKSTPVKE